MLFAIASVFALREFITLTPTRPGDHLPLVVCFYVLLPVQYWLIGDDWYGPVRDLPAGLRVPAAAGADRLPATPSSFSSA